MSYWVSFDGDWGGGDVFEAETVPPCFMNPNQRIKTQESKPRNQNPEIQTKESKPRNPNQGIQTQESKPRNPIPGIQNKESKSKDLKSKFLKHQPS